MSSIYNGISPFWIYPYHVILCSSFYFLEVSFFPFLFLPSFALTHLSLSIPIAILRLYFNLDSVQFSSVPQSYPTLCDPMNRSTPGLPVHHQLPEFTQTHVHRVSDAIQLLLPPIPPSIRVFSNEVCL